MYTKKGVRGQGSEVSGKNRSPIPDSQSLSRKAVVLLSGGIDSSTALAIARSEGYELYSLTFDYGQRHKRELESARMVSEDLGAVKHLVVKFDLREIGGSALTSDIEVPKAGAGGQGLGIGSSNRPKLVPNPQSLIPATYVPARNTIFLSFGLAWAEVLGAGAIFIGANAVDYSGYPDCRPEYLEAFQDMANLATRASVEGKMKFEIKAPLLHMTKSEIIKTGSELGLDYSLTWSCYDPQPLNRKGIRDQGLGVSKKDQSPTPKPEYLPCGRCDSCLFRAKGFDGAGVKDPLNP